MDPLDREDLVRRLQRNMDPNQRTAVNGSIEMFPDTDGDWNNNNADDAKCTLRSTGLRRVWRDFIKEPKAEEDPDGEAFDMDEDPELTRKKQELRKLREMIMRKKASLVKKVNAFVQDTLTPGSSMPATCKGATLKERVKVILEHRRSLSSLSVVQSPVKRMNSSNKDLLQEDHPLKLRVQALMRKRCRDPCVIPTNREVPDVTLPPPRQSDTSPVMEEDTINQGFQRFLAVLNKGVDIEFLNRIVTDDGEDLLNIQPLAVENKSGLFFRSESHGSNGGTSLLGRSQTNSGERKSNPPSRERSLSFQLPHESRSSDRLDLRVGSRSRSRSPSPVKKKKKEGEEENPKVNDQHEQLQNILKSLGLSLEEEEMTNLAKRTQERLYGKKNEDEREEMSQQKGSHKPYRSPSSSSSSASMSRSASPSPSHRRRSHSRDSRRRRTSDRSGSINRSRDGRTSQDDNRDSGETAKHGDRDEDGNEFKEISTYQHPYPQNQTDPHPHPSAFPNYRQSQYSQYYDSRCGSYSAAGVSYWTYTQNGIPPHLDPSSYHHFPASVRAPKMFEHCDTPLINRHLLMNPDLSECEGQTGSLYGSRCLSTVRQTQAQSCQKKGQEANTTWVNSINNKSNHGSRQQRGAVGKQTKDTKVPGGPNRSLSKGQVGLIDPPHCTQVTSTVLTKSESRKIQRQRKKRNRRLRKMEAPHSNKQDSRPKQSRQEAAEAAAATLAAMRRKQKASAVVKVEAPHSNKQDSRPKQSRREAAAAAATAAATTRKQTASAVVKVEAPHSNKQDSRPKQSRRAAAAAAATLAAMRRKQTASAVVKVEAPHSNEQDSRAKQSAAAAAAAAAAATAAATATAAAAAATRKQTASAVVKVEAPHSNEQESGGDKQPLTEKQIMDNLRTKLKAFNQRAKQQKPTVPTDCHTSQDSSKLRPVEFHECHFDFNLM